MKVFFLSLGCDKNLCDSEHMMKYLADAGYGFTDSESEADVAVVNTCSFIGDAKEESVNEIFRIAAYKKTGRLKALVVTGCLPERYQKEFMEELPEVDACLGINDWDRIADMVKQALEGKRVSSFSGEERLPVSGGRILTGGGYSSFLKIAEGCDKRCTYCAIPLIRGGYRSVPMEELLREASEMANSGVRELNLVAQETTRYGVDLYGGKRLDVLVNALSEIEGIRWIRILYCYPEEITESLVEVLRTNPKVVPYLDLPVQHFSDTVLKRMNRKTTGKEILETIAMLREKVPGITLRTTVMTGFPGETEEEFEALLDGIRKASFDRLGAFSFSPEEGTGAYRMKPYVPKRVREARKKRVMELQQSIVFSKAEQKIGKRMEVLVEGRLSGEENVYAARTKADAPDVDGMLFFQSDRPFESGDFAVVRVTGSEGYDLIGELSE